MSGGGSVAALGLGAAALWGSADFSGGLATRKASPAFVVAVAHGFSLILLLVAAIFVHPGASVFSPYGLLSGVFCGGGLIALYAALSQGSMGLSAALSGVLAAIVPVLYSLFREGRAPAPKMIGFGVAALAIWLVAYTPDFSSGSAATNPERHSRGLFLAVLAGLSFGAMLIFMHLAAAAGPFPALIAIRIASTSVAIFGGVILWLSAAGKQSEAPARSAFPVRRALLLAILAGILDTSGNVLYLFASRIGRLDVAAVLSSLYPAGTMLLAIWLLRERATRSQAAGMALALAAVALISI